MIMVKTKQKLSFILIIVMLVSNTLQVFAAEWVARDSAWYHYNDSQELDKGWYQDSYSSWYHLDNSGRMDTGWYTDADGGRYYLNQKNEGTEGLMKYGWYQDSQGKWYFLDNRHQGHFGRTLVSGWNWIDGYCYYFNADGSMLSGALTPDGYIVDENGRWVDNGTVQFIAGKGISTSMSAGTNSGSRGGGSGGSGGSGGGNTNPEVTYVLLSSKNEISLNSSDNEVVFTVDVGSTDCEVLLYNVQTKATQQMFDDGNVDEHGDDIAEDGVFSTKSYVDTSQEARLKYYAGITKEGKNSNTKEISIQIFHILTDSEIQSMEDFSESPKAQGFMTKAAQIIDDTGKNELRAEVEDYMTDGVASQDITSYVWSDDKDSVAFEYSTGVLEVFELWGEESEESIFGYPKASPSSADEDIDSDIPDKDDEYVKASPSNTLKDKDREYDPDLIVKDPVLEKQLYARNANFSSGVFDKNLIKNNKAIILSAFTESDKLIYYSAFKELNDKLNKFDKYKFDSTIKYNATVDNFKQLENYGMVFINAHGTVGSSGWLWWKEKFPVICLSEQQTKDNLKKYSSDLKEKRIIKSKSSSGNSYWITPDFFNYYYNNNQLDGTLIYSCTCHGFHNDKLADAFLNGGAEAFVGFTDTVQCQYNNNILEEMMNQMLEGQTLSTAVEAAIQKYGTNDRDSTPAFTKMAGNEELKLMSGGLLNGGFEELLNWWNRTGDARSISTLKSLVPQEGKRMAIVSTGLGSVNDSNSALIQTFIVPQGAKNLEFSWNFVSEEPMEFINSVYDDTVEINLYTTSGEKTTILKSTVNTANWKELGGDYFDGGDNTTYHTDWTAESFDISQYAGESLTLSFWVYDKGDSIYDSAALIDHIRITD